MSIIRNFSLAGGELAPALYARCDQVKYATGARVMKNAYIPRSGGGFNRPGSVFSCEVKNSDEAVRLIPFVYDADNSYVLLFGDLYMWVIKNGELVLQSDTDKSIISIEKGATTVVHATTHGYTAGDTVYITGVEGMTELNGRYFVIDYAEVNSFQLLYLDGTAVDSSDFGEYESGGTSQKVFETDSPYESATLANLQYTQSADVMFIVAGNTDVYEVNRFADDNWTLTAADLEPDLESPTDFANNGTAGTTTRWRVYSIGADGEQSSPPDVTTSNTVPSANTTVTLTFTPVDDAAYYNITRNFGLIGSVTGTPLTTATFLDNGQDAEWFDSRGGSIFGGRQPATVGFYQQRLLLANIQGPSVTEPETIYCSWIGHYRNFDYIGPVGDNYPFAFSVPGRQVNEIRHLIDLERLVILTSSSIYVAQGDDSGALTPSTINLKQVYSVGSATLRPIIADNSLLFVEARQSIVRDLNFEIQTSGYRGNDLTTFATHLFDGYTLSDWDYQRTPHSTIWVARNDGVMLCCTYIKEQQIVGWNRHYFGAVDQDGVTDNTAGLLKNVVGIPEGTQDVIYMVVERQHHGYADDSETGRVKKFVERFVIEPIDDPKDMVYMDSARTFDGRNTNTAHTMTLSGGTTWGHLENLTLTSSSAFFDEDEVGNEIQMTSEDGDYIRARITGYTSTTVVTVRANKTVPSSLRSTATSDWTRAVDVITGLWNLEGYEVSVLADGYVVSSPYNPKYATLTVENGSITLPRPFGVVHVGLPYISDIETLDVDTANGETLIDKKKNIQSVSVFVEKSRGIFAGMNPGDDESLEGLYELKQRQTENYDEPVELATEVVEIKIRSDWNSNGRVLLRQVDPLPMNVLSIAPSGYIPFKGGQ